jgi:hypothetical protein
MLRLRPSTDSCGVPARTPGIAERTSNGRKPAMELLRRIGVGIVILVGLLLPHDVAVAQDLTGSIQTSRMTIVGINRETRRIVCMNSLGRVSEHRVTNEARVVTDDKTATDLALLNTGDVIRAELRAGRIHKIIVLRQGWHETASPEQ